MFDILKNLLGSIVLVVMMAVLLFFANGTAFMIFVPFGVGLVLGSSATQLGMLMRRLAIWEVVEEITDWRKVHEMLDDKGQGARTQPSA